tara:strand:+ start:545 stop:772 length:228 start_codon:yes stop_codon:yes gene_type:complete
MTEKNLQPPNFLTTSLSYWNTQKQEALTILSLYFGNPLAVADHPNHMAVIKEWTLKLAEADDAIATLQKYFQQSS